MSNIFKIGWLHIKIWLCTSEKLESLAIPDLHVLRSVPPSEGACPLARVLSACCYPNTGLAPVAICPFTCSGLFLKIEKHLSEPRSPIWCGIRSFSLSVQLLWPPDPPFRRLSWILVQVRSVTLSPNLAWLPVLGPSHYPPPSLSLSSSLPVTCSDPQPSLAIWKSRTSENLTCHLFDSKI